MILVSCFGRTRHKKWPEMEKSEQQGLQRNVGLLALIDEYLMPGCVRIRKHTMKEKSQLHLQEKREQKLTLKLKPKQKRKNKMKLQQEQVQKEKQFTLEHFLINSPDSGNYCTSADDGSQALRQSPIKVYPSVAGFASNPRGNFSEESLLDDDRVCSSETDVSPLRSRQSGRRKKVRFTLPRESDIFMYSPQQDSSEKTDKMHSYALVQ